jgi:predicted acetyltransferase
MASFSGEIELASGYSSLRQAPESGATARLITLEDARTLVPPVYDRVRATTPGMFERTKDWWELRTLADPPDRRQGGGVKNVLLLELDGTPAGYALYRVHMKFEHGSAAGKLEVIEALADGPVATRELWRVLLDMDWKATLTAGLLPIDHPLQHQLSYPRRMQMRISDGLWVRLVDVGAALSARAYGGDGPVVLEVEDSFLPENSGRWRIAGGTVERTDDDADIGLDVGELGSAYLGGFTFAELVRAGVVRELKEGGAARADAVFLTAAPKPWCPEIF